MAMELKEAQKRVDELMLELVKIGKAHPSINIGFFTNCEELKTIRGTIVGDPVEVVKSMIIATMKEPRLAPIFCGAFAAVNDFMQNTPPPSEKQSDSSPVSQTER